MKSCFLFENPLPIIPRPNLRELLLALHPNVPNPRVVLVTDRVDLDDQIYGTFHACGKSVAQAQSGKHLVRMVTGQLGKGERATDVNPAYYRKFSELIAETIRAYREGRISELDYLAQAETQMENLRTRRDNSQPGDLARYRHAPAYYGALSEQLGSYGVDDTQLAQAAIRQEEIIESYKVMDWAGNLDVKQAIRRALDDHFYALERELDLTLSSAELDALIEQVLEIAIARDRIV